MPPLFDTYLFVDWSARTGRSPARPRKDAIWIGSKRRDAAPAARYCRTRAEAAGLVRDALVETLDRGQRALVGFDFAYGYPAGLAGAAGLVGTPWRATWDAIAALLEDGDDNRSNRFAVAASLNEAVSGGPGPFWGCPPSGRSRALHSTGPGFPFQPSRGARLDRLRECDRRLRGTQEVWKLFGAGSVGSQSLAGIPRVRALRDDPRLATSSAVWPFETGFTAAVAARIVHAEIWPGVVKERAARHAELIPDEAQVLALCEWASELDARGELGPWLERPIDLDDGQLTRVLEEEGWVLGAR